MKPEVKDKCPKWLEKFGFHIDQRIHETGNYDYWADNGLLIVSFLEDEFSVRLRSAGSQTFLDHIKHVHQLQNLYFALTGEELEIKELA